MTADARSGPPHLLDEFAPSAEDPDPIPDQRTLLVTSAGVLVGIVVACLAFVGGLVWAIGHEPGLSYENVFAELGIKVAYALLVGASCAFVVVALGLAAVVALWLRRRLPTGRHRDAATVDGEPPTG